MSRVKVEEAIHSEYGRCLRISNETATLYVSLDYGPRIIHYALGDGPNVMFFNRDPDYVKRGEDFDDRFYPGAFWNIYGGNRLWVAPHNFPLAFYPDNEPVAFEHIENGARFIPRPRRETGVRVTTEVRLDETSSRVMIRHNIENMGAAPKRMAAWSITSVDAGGLEIIPQTASKTGVLPNRHISLWPYSSMRDARVFWGARHIFLKQDALNESPLKIGINNENGWACYLNKGLCFLVSYRHDPAAEYPDFGVSYETFTDDRMVEMETMSPLKIVPPGESVEQVETWQLCPIDDPAEAIRAYDAADEGRLSTLVDSIFSDELIVAP
ncbi:MAG TPA: hypothetical protein VN445_08340 [Rectinemataceae bacterium]|nr:hypothetical protein [Rectinemataceae bacterium]